MFRMKRDEAQRGNALILTLIAFTLLFGFSTAQVMVYLKNQQQADFFTERSRLRSFAESGLAIAIHDVRENVTANPGFVGTQNWTVDVDYGADGLPSTLDYGEGDGLPTPGEPNISPEQIGDVSDSANLIVFVEPTAFANVQRVIATSYTNEESVTVEELLQTDVVQVPKVAAVYVDPTSALDLKGNAFMIDGNDYNPDGTAGPESALPGIVTENGDPPGDNQAALLSQLQTADYDQIDGLGGTPSLGETDPVDVSALVSEFMSVSTNPVTAGTYSNITWGDWNSSQLEVTTVEGDLHLTGNGSGAGVLVVDGDLTIAGDFTFNGLILVRGDVRLTGGGSSVHVYGSVLVTESFNAIDSELSVLGTADLFYSSETLNAAQTLINGNPDYVAVYYDEE